MRRWSSLLASVGQELCCGPTLSSASKADVIQDMGCLQHPGGGGRGVADQWAGLLGPHGVLSWCQCSGTMKRSLPSRGKGAVSRNDHPGGRPFVLQ